MGLHAHFSWLLDGIELASEEAARGPSRTSASLCGGRPVMGVSTAMAAVTAAGAGIAIGNGSA
jgi:hypothetical protein